MLRAALFIALAFLALYVETTFLSSWPSANLRFDLVWLIVIYLALSAPLSQCGPLAIMLGLMEDMAGAPFLGFFATVYFCVVVSLRAFMVHLFVETLWARLIWVGILTIMALLLEWGLMALMGMADGIRTLFLTYVLFQSLINMVVAALFFPLLERVDQFSYRQSYVS